ncbi:MAG: ATP-dependent RecD-like DNA helicase [Firmicutes bacterium]|nr:ATP-dependent RecD-like DNA helicase [Bacillota bacterium]
MSTVQGVVERITYRNEQSFYTVVRLVEESGTRTQAGQDGQLRGASGRRGEGAVRKGAFTAVGVFLTINCGETMRLTGEWTSHPEYGLQFKMSEYEVLSPATLEGIERYLSSGIIKGIGPATARKIVRRFGLDTLDVLMADPARIAEIEGVGPKKAGTIAQGLQEHREIQDVMVFLRGHGVSPGFATRIFRRYGKRTVEMVRENPYRLAEDVLGIGFRTADKIAQDLGVAPDSPKRIAAHLVHLLNEGVADGHVFVPEEDLIETTGNILEVDPSLARTALGHLERAGTVVIERSPDSSGRPPEEAAEALDGLPEDRAGSEPGPTLVEPSRSLGVVSRAYLPAFYHAEKSAALRLASLVRQHSSPALLASPESFDDEIDAELELFCQELGLTLAPAQESAVRQAVNHGLLVVTGGPGTGKTTIVRAIVGLLERRGMRVMLASPTGRAAQRLREATGREAKTVHRLLEFKFDEAQGLRFGRDDTNPLSTDAVIVDEASMIDLLLMNSLLKALRPGTRLVLVGDVDQLPSVGAGSVLREVIASEAVPVVRLNQVFRQASQSMIVVNAHRINSGSYPIFKTREGDCFFVEEEDAERIALEVKDLVATRVPGFLNCDPTRDIQVLTPIRKGKAGVLQLNVLLQQALNPPSPSKAEMTVRSETFREGDKVMQIRNNYRLPWRGSASEQGVWNGDLGQVTHIDREEGTVVVRFYDGKEVEYDRDDLDDLVLSYACTIHKSQGNEFPVAIIPVIWTMPAMMTRNLLYTALTRARQMAVLVGSKRALWYYIKNREVGRRCTAMAERLRMAVGGTGAWPNL